MQLQPPTFLSTCLTETGDAAFFTGFETCFFSSFTGVALATGAIVELLG